MATEITPTPTEGRWLDAEQQRSWRALLMGTTLLLGRLDDELGEAFGVSMTEYEVLVRLSESEGQLRMAHLADAMAYSRSRITHTINRMQAAGLVERRNASDDGRGVVAHLTPHGMAMLRMMAPVHVNGVRDHLVDLVSPEDFAALGRVMNTVADHLVAGHPEMEMRDA